MLAGRERSDWGSTRRAEGVMQKTGLKTVWKVYEAVRGDGQNGGG